MAAAVRRHLRTLDRKRDVTVTDEVTDDRGGGGYASSRSPDQDRAVEFYTEKLGLDKRVELSVGPGFRCLGVAQPDAATTIALCPSSPGVSVDGKHAGISLQTDDVDAYHAKLKAQGVDVDAEIDRFGE
jgi:catechol 2,3-dioxygenase-like lactoylglutathione lyase family enzyme